MPVFLPNPDNLFDRTWRPGRPLRPRMCRARRWGMLAAFILLSAVISIYAYFTDSERVRHMAGDYLTDLLGCRVEIGAADLSLFEGLRLDQVRVYLDHEPGSWPIFSAGTLLVHYDRRAILSGNLGASQIVAVNPRLRLSENLDNGLWNYQELVAAVRARAAKRAAGGAAPAAVPEILLRDGRVDYAEVSHGVMTQQGSMGVEAQISPTPEAQVYSYSVQSRGAEDLGPIARGDVNFASGRVTAELRNFAFGPDIKAMLSPEVRRVCESHDLQGRVEIPRFVYVPPSGNQPPHFSVEMLLSNVTMMFRPEEWLGPEASATAAAAAAQDAVGSTDAPRAAATTLEPVRLNQVSGMLVFTDDKGIEIRDLMGRVEGNALRVSGQVRGYSPDAPLDITVSNNPSENLFIPRSPRYMNSMPEDIRRAYNMLRPQGTCTAEIRVRREKGSARPQVSGQIDVVDGQFTFDQLPYPVRAATGRLIIDEDPATGLERLTIDHIRGHGIEGGPNADSNLTIDGWVAPLDERAGADVVVTGDNVNSEVALSKAFPPDVRAALEWFDPAGQGKGNGPQFHGRFLCRVQVPFLHATMPKIDTEVTLDDAAGTFALFPYPLRHLAGTLKVRDGRVDIDGHMNRDTSSVSILGNVTWESMDENGGPPRPDHPEFIKLETLRPDLHILAHDLPLDDSLRAALPEGPRGWLTDLGATGMLDIDGHVFAADHAPTTQSTALSTTDPPGARALSALSTAAPTTAPAVDFDVSVAVHDGGLKINHSTFAVSDLAGDLRIQPTRVDLMNLRAHRGASDLSGGGTIRWSGDDPKVQFTAQARDLQLDKLLYNSLPASGRAAWDSVRPDGTADVQMIWGGGAPVVAEPAVAAASDTTIPGAAARSAPVAPATAESASTTPFPGAAPTTRPLAAVPTASAPAVIAAAPSTAPASDDSTLTVVIRPRELSILPVVVPYPLEHLHGTITVNGPQVRLDDLTAVHDHARVSISGRGSLENDSRWDLKLAANNLTIDDTLLKAMPAALSELVKSLELHGQIDVDFSKLLYHSVGGPTVANAAGAVGSSDARPASRSTVTAASAAPAPIAGPDVDYAVRITSSSISGNVGVPLTDVKGSFALAGTVRDGRLSALSGDLLADSLTVAGRTAAEVHAVLTKPADSTSVQISRIQAIYCGGDLAGDVGIFYPDSGPARYSVNFVMRDVDMRRLAGTADKDVRGSLTASLTMDGTVDQPATRHGRGDVDITGKDMYHVPVVLGLLQITNLSLPITSPFSQASARYSVQGQRINMEEILLKSANMTMQGGGTLDFDTRKVSLTFVTDNPNWPKLPVVGSFLQGAKDELLQIHVDGTLQAPRVSASSFDTVTTTVDQVFAGDHR